MQVTRTVYSFSQSVELQKLMLNHNHLTDLTDNIGLMVTLSTLDASYNNLASIPNAIAE